MLPCYNHISERINFHFMLITQTQANAETTAVWRGRKHDYQIIVVMVPVGCILGTDHQTVCKHEVDDGALLTETYGLLK